LRLGDDARPWISPFRSGKETPTDADAHARIALMSREPDSTAEPGEATGQRIPRPVPGHLDVPGIIQTFAEKMMYEVAKDEFTAAELDVYHALAYAVRDRLMERWFLTQDTYYRSDAKRVYYLSMEFLPGRVLINNIINLGAYPAYVRAVEKLGYQLSSVAEREVDPGLGGGGLGRLAACFIDSASTLALPFFGYGIRYEYGIFRQRIKDGQQVEAPDNWLRYGNPWEIARPDALVPINFYGKTIEFRDDDGNVRADWVDTENVYAVAYDVPVLGYRNDTVNSLRLWSARSTREFDLATFNAGDYVHAVEDKTRSENISKVLYPPDDQMAGKELRLKQQYFFVSATLQDVIRRFKKRERHTWDTLPDKVAVQLNDTHPAVAIPSLMRLLVDKERLDWEPAWEITQAVFGFTNHTVLPEALESWPLSIFGRLLPRHLEIIEEIDRRFRGRIRGRFPGDEERVKRAAILGPENGGVVRMAHLAIVGSHAVNGVAKIHTEILKNETFRDFHDLFPGRFRNKTNGITPRRWLLMSNPDLAALITETIGEKWITNLDELARLKGFSGDASFRERWAAVKRANKVRLGDTCSRLHGFVLDPDAMLDAQVKRIHEYKRQVLNALHVLALRQRIRDGRDAGPPRTVLLAGKAAPGYIMAKLIIRLLNAVAGAVNTDPAMKGKLSVFFFPNYSVSCAEKIFPACDLSEQISTAGHEASGTGNMKAALNGSVTIGTLDGANIEILESVGPENILIFGKTADEISALKKAGDDSKRYAAENAELARAISEIPRLPGAENGVFQPIVQELLGHDRFFNCADFSSYVAAQERAAKVFGTEDWTRMAISNVAGMGPFSSDRAVHEYAEDIWKVAPVPVRFEG
jgi:starch phosphorylase